MVLLIGQKRLFKRAGGVFLMSLWGCVPPSFADNNPIQSVTANLSNGAALGQRQLLGVADVDGVVSIFVSNKESSSDEDLKKSALSLVKAVNVEGILPVKVLSIDFVDKVQNEFAPVHRITLQEKELADLRGVAAGDDSAAAKLLDGATIAYEQMSLHIRSTAAVKTGAVVQNTASRATSDAELSRQFISLRAKTGARLTALQGKGVGVKPFQEGLAKVDASYKRDDLKGAFAGLSALQESLSDQESRYYAMHAKAAVAQAPVKGRGGIGEVSVNTASRDDYYNKMVQNILEKELGGDAPVDGPFQLERFRIAKAIHQFSSQGRDMSGPHYLFKQIEALVAANDNSKIPEIVDKLNYLQKQLGLPPLSR